jgi:hypothetical protein
MLDKLLLDKLDMYKKVDLKESKKNFTYVCG